MATAQIKIDWYDRRHELEGGQVFRCEDGSIVKLEHRKPGDGTDWIVQDWYSGNSAFPDYAGGYWIADENSLHPSELAERLPDNFAGEAA